LDRLDYVELGFKPNPRQLNHVEIGWNLWGALPHFLPQRDCLLAVPGYGSQTRPDQRDGPALAGDHTLPAAPNRYGRCNARANAGHMEVMARNTDGDEALPRELAEVRFSRLYRDHEQEVLRYALRRSADPQDAADVVAETFLVAWRRLGDVPVHDEARLWLYATARRILANHQRGIKRRTRLAERLREELRRQLPLPAAAAERPVLDALAAMSDADRELLMLVAMEELSPSEAARVLGISTMAARTRLHRARRRLRARLGEQSEEAKPNEIEMGEAR
jgi:RNA polymerase sigma-70 factor, ECF subfamily